MDKNLHRHFCRDDIQIANKHMKRCSILLIIRERKIKTTMKYHVIFITKHSKVTETKCWQRCGKIGTFVHYCWEGKMVQLLWKTVQMFLQKKKRNYDPVIPFLSKYPKELKAKPRRDICIPRFTEARFTISKRQKQPKCPLTDKWKKKIWCISRICIQNPQWNILQT